MEDRAVLWAERETERTQRKKPQNDKVTRCNEQARCEAEKRYALSERRLVSRSTFGSGQQIQNGSQPFLPINHNTCSASPDFHSWAISQRSSPCGRICGP